MDSKTVQSHPSSGGAEPHPATWPGARPHPSVREQFRPPEAVIASLHRLPGGSEVDVHLVGDVQEAMDFCQKQVPEALILDLAMPNSACFTLVSWLRQQPSLCTLPLLVYSGREITPEERDQLRLGPTHFLTSPRIQPEEVEDMVFAMVPHMHFPFRDQPSA